ncbi:unnamed protein product [Schistosoma intercalatum]|nr:unnamed protein product [Schistosoma intercalatum]
MGITITWLQSSLQTPQKPNIVSVSDPTAVGRDNVVAVQSPDSTKTKYRFSEWNQDVNCVIDFRKLGELQRANMFRSQVAVVWFLFFFLVCNAGDQEVAAETLEFSSKDIAVNKLSVRVKEWDEIIEKGPAGVSLRFLDKYCANVVDVVKELEPKLSSATLSCDIDHSQRPNDIRVDNIKVELAVLSNEMENVFSSKTWFPSLKNTLESGSVNVNSAWIIDIVSVSDQKADVRDSHLFNQTYPKALLAIDKCPKLKIIMSNIYPGFGETMTKCSFDVLREVISTTMDYRELMKKGYCCSEYNIYRRIYWSIYELLYKEESGGNTIEPRKITQPEITIDEKNTTLGHCIYASFPSGKL